MLAINDARTLLPTTVYENNLEMNDSITIKVCAGWSLNFATNWLWIALRQIWYWILV